MGSMTLAFLATAPTTRSAVAAMAISTAVAAVIVATWRLLRARRDILLLVAAQAAGQRCCVVWIGHADAAQQGGRVVGAKLGYQSSRRYRGYPRRRPAPQQQHPP